MSAAGDAPPYVFMGTSAFAVEVLRRLHGAGLTPALAITPPDRARGRGSKLAAPPVAKAERGLGVEIQQTPS
ncbi:MAG: methionyl-tRNA formyltransferase, partial [Solirubrobacterales bacterium]